MSYPELVAADDTVTVTAHAQVKHLCPFKEEIDTGTVTIVWTCNGFTIELHSLADYLTAFTTQPISHEDLTALIAADLQTVGRGITINSVTTRFTTAGLTVEVSRAVPDHTVGT